MGYQVLVGDCRETLRTLPDQSVHCVVTSPPYFGLRDYGVGGQIGLEPTPDEFVAALVEVFREVRRVLRDDGTVWLNLGDSYAGYHGNKNAEYCNAPSNKGGYFENQRASTVGLSGLKQKDLIGIPWRVAFALQQPWERVHIKDRIDRAWLAALVDGEGCLTIMQAQNGEKSATSFPPVLQVKMTDPECIEHANSITGFEQCLRQDSPSRGGKRETFQWRITSRRAADIVAEIYPFLRIKRKQAVVLWNHQLVRDSYETKRGVPMPAEAREKQIQCRDLIQRLNQRQPVDLPSWMVEPRITTEPGWYLRQDVIWHKPNPMPESVRDRCTKAHEYIFMLTKSPRYFYDHEAIKEPAATDDAKRWTDGGSEKQRGHGRRHAGFNGRYAERIMREGAPATRNKRSVWTVTTKPFKGAHFATFPPDLIEPCVLAGTSEHGVCRSCGAPWERTSPATAGWRPTCGCADNEPVPATVLDPFGGSGTTAGVAVSHGRDAILCELNPEYAALAPDRVEAVQRFFDRRRPSNDNEPGTRAGHEEQLELLQGATWSE